MSRKSVIPFYKINDFFMKYEDENYTSIDKNNNNDECDSWEARKRRKVDVHKQCRRGEKAFEAGHVKNFVYDPTRLVVKGSVRASMKAQNYKPIAFLNEDYTIKDATCDCARGIACHHISALLLSAHFHLSVTDVECTWKAKPSEDRNDGVPFNELFPPSKSFCAIQEPSEAEVKVICDNIFICGRGCAGFAWMLQPEPDVSCDTNVPTVIPNIKDIIGSREFFVSKDKFSFVLSKLSMQPSAIISIAAATTGQISNPLWCEARQCRFSGSTLGSIIHAAAKHRKLAPSLLQTISCQAMLRPNTGNQVKRGKYSIKVNPRQWGQDHELEAKDTFMKLMGLSVKDTGLWIHESGFWCASPDGLVGENAVLEIKCPYQFRQEKSLKKCLDRGVFFKTAPSKRYAIYYDKDLDNFYMWKEHEYYHQVQGEMWCTYRELCYFVVWIPEDVAVVVVERDDRWYEDNVPRLEQAFKEQFLPTLMKRKT